MMTHAVSGRRPARSAGRRLALWAWLAAGSWLGAPSPAGAVPEFPAPAIAWSADPPMAEMVQAAAPAKPAAPAEDGTDLLAYYADGRALSRTRSGAVSQSRPAIVCVFRRIRVPDETTMKMSFQASQENLSRLELEDPKLREAIKANDQILGHMLIAAGTRKALEVRGVQVGQFLDSASLSWDGCDVYLFARVDSPAAHLAGSAVTALPAIKRSEWLARAGEELESLKRQEQAHSSQMQEILGGRLPGIGVFRQSGSGAACLVAGTVDIPVLRALVAAGKPYVWAQALVGKAFASVEAVGLAFKARECGFFAGTSAETSVLLRALGRDGIQTNFWNWYSEADVAAARQKATAQEAEEERAAHEQAERVRLQQEKEAAARAEADAERERTRARDRCTVDPKCAIEYRGLTEEAEDRAHEAAMYLCQVAIYSAAENHAMILDLTQHAEELLPAECATCRTGITQIGTAAGIRVLQGMKSLSRVPKPGADPVEFAKGACRDELKGQQLPTRVEVPHLPR
jgi:hypothetical protein